MRKLELFEGVKFHDTEELSADTQIGQWSRVIVSKYSYLSPETLPGHISAEDYLRWALKPILLHKILRAENIDHILFCDCDIHFYNDFGFILDEFESNRIILSPHWRPIRPSVDNDFKWNFLHGFYNAGFVGVRKDALDMLEWWGEMCAIECSADVNDRGTYVDQKYLDAVPLYFDGVHILRHKGCNVAAWNSRQLPREINEHGDVTIAGDPLIFVHYSGVTVNHITKGLDAKLHEVYFRYQEILKRKRLELVRRGMPECVSRRETDQQTVI
jgi:hypothetical protein